MDLVNNSMTKVAALDERGVTLEKDGKPTKFIPWGEDTEARAAAAAADKKASKASSNATAALSKAEVATGKADAAQATADEAKEIAKKAGGGAALETKEYPFTLENASGSWHSRSFGDVAMISAHAEALFDNSYVIGSIEDGFEPFTDSKFIVPASAYKEVAGTWIPCMVFVEIGRDVKIVAIEGTTDLDQKLADIHLVTTFIVDGLADM